MTAVLAAIGTEIRVRSFPFSLTLIDICRSEGYTVRRRKSPLWQGVKDFQKNRFRIFKFYMAADPNINLAVLF